MLATTKKPIKYLHKNSLYIFPPQTKIFVWGKDAIIDIPGRKPVNILKYQPKKVLSDKTALVGLPVTDIGARLSSEYKQISDFLSKNPKLSLLAFEYATSHELALLIFFKSQDMLDAERLLEEIRATLPYLINIFRNPVIHLKDVDAVLSLDAVKRVNQSTIKHLSTHSENWENIKSGSIMPRRLLTRVYEDDFGIYENVVFRDLVRQILTFLKKRISLLAEAIDTLNESVKLEEFSRLVHSAYYLAIGKLYSGFFKAENSVEISAMLKETKELYDRLGSFRNRSVYTKNSNVKPISGAIKKTNILSMHRDYKHVYLLYNKMQKGSIKPQSAEAYKKHTKLNYPQQVQSQHSYGQFCQMLALFAAAGFNFKCDSSRIVFDGGNVSASLKFMDWSLTVTSKLNKLLNFYTIDFIVKHKKSTVKYLLVPLAYYTGENKKRYIMHIVERLHSKKSPYFKYVFLDPFAASKSFEYGYELHTDNGLNYAVLPVSINEINSFRRLQKILFEGMTLANKKDDVCGFCGGGFKKTEDGKLHCAKCKTTLITVKCLDCGVDYKSVFVENKANRRDKRENVSEDLSEFYKQEKRHFFRSVNLKHDTPACPGCGKIADKNKKADTL